jgi:hypothetical protein
MKGVSGKVMPSNEEQLWSRPVPTFTEPNAELGRFHDLKGNVAEFVLDAGSASNLAVIGGSAISDPANFAQNVAKPNPSNSYADVGIRLTFHHSTTGVPPIVRERFEDILKSEIANPANQPASGSH